MQLSYLGPEKSGKEMKVPRWGVVEHKQTLSQETVFPALLQERSGVSVGLT